MKNDLKIVNHQVEDDADICAAVRVRRQAVCFNEARVGQPFFQGAQHGIKPLNVPNLQNQLVDCGDLGEFAGLLGRFGNWLFHEKMFTGSEEAVSHLVMRVGGRGDGGSVNLLRELIERAGRHRAILATDGSGTRRINIKHGRKLRVRHIRIKPGVIAADMANANNSYPQFFCFHLTDPPLLERYQPLLPASSGSWISALTFALPCVGAVVRRRRRSALHCRENFARITCFRIFFSAPMRNCRLVKKSRGRLPVQKTYKLYIGGKFVRGENGRVLPAADQRRNLLANFCRASKKDFRDAVGAARAAFPNWLKMSAYLRGQILYRAAEMLERRRPELEEELARLNGAQPARSAAEVALTVDRLVHYAGWTDKFTQLFGAVNPVASSHFNFTTPEPTGVVVVICPDEPPLLAFISLVAPVILSGNTVVVLPSTTKPLPALTFSEIIATSDLPAGVVNVLAGDRAELAPHFASHMDVNAIVDASADATIARQVAEGGAFNMKRCVRRDLRPNDWAGEHAEDPYWILDTVEMKTAWHPIGL
jgi:hypothetical protein